jgi:hypothetical protein
MRRLASIALMTFCAWADTIPITGTASRSFANVSVQIDGPGLSFRESTGGPSLSPIASCPSPSGPCQLTTTFGIPPFFPFFWSLLYNGIEIEGNPVSANGTINGFLRVTTGTFLYESAVITVPVSVSGVLQGFQNGQTAPFADLVLIGEGTAVITPWPGGIPQNISGIAATFSGTATSVPEPGGWFLVGAGVLCLLARRLSGVSPKLEKLDHYIG